jgi:hypothetical protein
MRVLRRLGILIAGAALGTGAAVGAAACGEDRGGDVRFEDGTGTAGTETGGTGTETGATETETGGTGTETGATETEAGATETTETSP